MRNILLRIADALRSRYNPSPLRKAEVTEFLGRRVALSHEEWFRRFAEPRGIPLEFVTWFRETCSRCFGYDLSAAVPDDRLMEDLGARDATWADLDLDILEQYEEDYGTAFPTQERKPIRTFGELLDELWSHARNHSPRFRDP